MPATHPSGSPARHLSLVAPPLDQQAAPDWLPADSAAAVRIMAHDWSATTLGSPDEWPEALRSTLRLVLASGMPTLITWGPDLLTFYNDAYAPILNGKPEALGQPFSVVFAEAWERVSPIMARAYSGEACYFEDFEVTLLRDGAPRFTVWTFSYSPIRDHRGVVQGVMCIVVETTRQRLAEEQLTRSEANLRFFSDAVPSLQWRSDPGGEPRWSNARYKDYFGADDRSGFDPMSAVHPDDLAGVEQEWRAARDEQRPFRHRHRIRSRAGEYRWFMAHSEPMFDAEGRISEWIGTAIDIHDHAVAHQELAETKAMFDGFAQNSIALLRIVDAATGTMPLVSQALTRLCGDDAAIAPTWPAWIAIVHADDRPRVTEALDRVLGGEVVQAEYRIVRTDRTVRWVRDTLFPIPSESGDIPRVGSIARDVTQQNRMAVHLLDSDAQSRAMRSLQLQALGYEVGPFADVESFLKVVRALVPGCVLLQSNAGDDVLEQVAAALGPKRDRLPLIVVCDVDDARRAVDLMKLGALDILPRAVDDGELEQAVSTALAKIRDAAVAASGPGDDPARELIDALPLRERQVLDRVVLGATNKVVARELEISPRTVETYRLRLMERLNASSLADLIRIAARAGILDT